MKRFSRLVGAAALAAATALIAGAAQAEPGQFAGNFSFQTDDLIAGPNVQILSGSAVAALQNNGTYRVSLVATDFFQNPEGSRRVYAVQLCTGQPDGGEMTITCQVVSTNSTNYTPDNFRLRQDPATPTLWRGTLSSSGSAPVEFLDLD